MPMERILDDDDDNDAPIPPAQTAAAYERMEDAMKDIENALLTREEGPIPHPAQVTELLDEEIGDKILADNGNSNNGASPVAVTDQEISSGGPSLDDVPQPLEDLSASPETTNVSTTDAISGTSQAQLIMDLMHHGPHPAPSSHEPSPRPRRDLTAPTLYDYEVEATPVPTVDGVIYEGTLVRDSQIQNPSGAVAAAPSDGDGGDDDRRRRPRNTLIIVALVLIIGVLAGIVGTLLTLLAPRSNKNSNGDGGKTQGGTEPITVSPSSGMTKKTSPGPTGRPSLQGSIRSTPASLAPSGMPTEITDVPTDPASLTPSGMPTEITHMPTVSLTQICLKVTTGSLPYQEGPLNVFVNSGSGYALVSTSGKTHSLGEVVVDQCFHEIVGIQVSNESMDSWVGFVELSADRKATYYPLICSDCTGTTNIMPIAVSNNGDVPDQTTTTTWCLEGYNCTLRLPSLIWKQMGGTITGHKREDRFGASVAISGDGLIVAVGAENNDDTGANTGHVKVYQWDESLFNYTQLGSTITGERDRDYLGNRVSLSFDGKTLAVGSSTCGDRNPDCERWALSGACDTNKGYMLTSCKRSCRSCGSGYGEGGTWIGGSGQTDTVWPWAGSVKVFILTRGWQRNGQTLVGEPGDLLGYSVALSHDGKIVAISAPGHNDGSGYVKVYRHEEGYYKQWGDTIFGDGDEYLGHSLALSGDGKTLAIGAPWNQTNGQQSGRVKACRIDEEQLTWNVFCQELSGEGANHYFGWSVSLSQGGNILAISAPRSGDDNSKSGHVTIYELDDKSIFEQRGSNIIGLWGDQLGESVSLSSDGNTLAVGARLNGLKGQGSGHAMIYRWDNMLLNYIQLGSSITGEAAGDQFGTAVALSSNGTRLAVGAHFAQEENGQVKVYKFENSTLL